MPARVAAILLAVTALLSASAAQADTELWSSDGPATPIAAGYGHIAFSAFDRATGRYSLMIGDRATTPVSIHAASVATSRRPFDVAIAKLGRVPVVLYSRCAFGRRGCDIFRYALIGGGGEAKIHAVSSASRDEVQPALTDTGKLVFVRRATRLVSTGFTSRTAKARVPCDEVYVGAVRGTTAPRRLSLPLCSQISALVTGKGKVVVIANGDPNVNPSTTLVALRLNGGVAKIRGRASAGSSGFSPFRALAFSGSSVIASQVGNRPDLQSGFVRYPIPSGGPSATPSPDIVGPFAVDGEETFTFSGRPGPILNGARAGGVCGAGSDAELSPLGTPIDQIIRGEAPCRLVQSTGLPTG